MRRHPCPWAVLNAHGTNVAEVFEWAYAGIIAIRGPSARWKRRRGVGLALERDTLAIVGPRASEPCPGVASGGAGREDSPRANRAREDMEETPFCGSDDGPFFRLTLSLHRPQRRVPSVRQAIDVIVDFLVHDFARDAITFRDERRVQVRTFAASLTNAYPAGAGIQGSGWDMCKLTKTDSAVLSLYLEMQYVNEIMARGYVVPPNLDLPAPARSKLTG